MESINVFVRFRPLTDLEYAHQCEYVSLQKSRPEEPLKMLNYSNSAVQAHNNKAYYFDNVFTESSSNDDIFEAAVNPLILSFIEGVNFTVFAYGQTSSGKTYTMRGTAENPGLVPLTIKHIFESKRLFSDAKFCLSLSYLEVYNEQVNDLLNAKQTKLKVRDNKSGKIEIENLTQIEIENEHQALELYEKGEINRKIADNSFNKQSSRSHSVFQMKLEKNYNGKTTFAELNLVDLAGSESLASSGPEEVQSREGSNINKSLLALSTLLDNIYCKQQGKSSFLGFRKSKLTRILKYSLSGDFKISIICTVSKSASKYQENLNTVMFGSKAKKIKFHAMPKEVYSAEFSNSHFQELNGKLIDLASEKRNLEVKNEELAEKIMKLEAELNETKGFLQVSFMESCNKKQFSIYDSYEPMRSLEIEIIDKNKQIYELEEKNKSIMRELSKKHEGSLQDFELYLEKIRELEGENKKTTDFSSAVQEENTKLEDKNLQLQQTIESLLIDNEKLKKELIFFKFPAGLEPFSSKPDASYLKKIRQLESDIFQLNNTIDSLKLVISKEQKKFADFQLQQNFKRHSNDLADDQENFSFKYNEKYQLKLLNLESNQRLEKLTIENKQLLEEIQRLSASEKKLIDNIVVLQEDNKKIIEKIEGIQEKSKEKLGPIKTSEQSQGFRGKKNKTVEKENSKINCNQ